MINISYSRIYLCSADAIALKSEPDYVKKRYNVVALLQLPPGIGITRAVAATMLKVTKRHIFRIQDRYRKEGVPGLRHRSRRPKNIPNISPEWIEKMVEDTSKKTGFSPQNVSIIVNEFLEREGSKKRVGPSLVYKILGRRGLAKQPEPPAKPLKNFDWKTPNNLVQSDITLMNKVPIVTMECDGTRKAWAKISKDQTTKNVTEVMARFGPKKYKNALTDNGKQFLESNPVWRAYKEKHIQHKHIHASVRHPQTLGKLSAYQRRLKEFIRYHMGESRNRTRMAQLIYVYNLFRNNARRHSTTKQYPEEMYSGKRKMNWFKRVVKTFKLQDVLVIP